MRGAGTVDADTVGDHLLVISQPRCGLVAGSLEGGSKCCGAADVRDGHAPGAALAHAVIVPNALAGCRVLTE